MQHLTLTLLYNELHYERSKVRQPSAALWTLFDSSRLINMSKVTMPAFASVLPVLKDGTGGWECCREVCSCSRDGGNPLAAGWGWHRLGPRLRQPASKDPSPISVVTFYDS